MFWLCLYFGVVGDCLYVYYGGGVCWDVVVCDVYVLGCEMGLVEKRIWRV